MPKSFRWAMVLWPGLVFAWQAGSLRALLICLGFVFALQAAWIGTFIWPGLLTGWESRLLWCSLAALVIGSILYQTYCAARDGQARLSLCSDRVLQEAQSEYLRGNYFEAEELLTPYVSQGEWDVEAALCLASIYRRTGRLEAAAVVLQTIESLERGGLWAAEIAQEYRKMKDSKRNKRTESL
ncbi:MAG: hypothetical protein NTV29_02750 [Planctomycetota bacterium]|nr:hypothetical protein [Planctomycetota bacterium]